MKNYLILLLLLLGTNVAIAGGNDTIPIEISKTITVNWSIKGSKIVQDDLFLKHKANKKAIKLELIDLVADGTELDLEACFKKSGKVTKGDVAFYLFDEIFNVPYPTAVGKAFPDILLSCKPPTGLYDYIQANRTTVSANMKAFYTKPIR
jgi:hypothetical protein